MLQFTSLLEPISDASPTGSDMSFSPEVDAINLARQFDDPSLDQGEWVVALKDADWPLVYEKCIALLAKQSKDLRIAAWLVEAAAKTRQFEGMAAGFELLAGLCDRYWDDLYPTMEDKDVEQRVGNLTWLLTRAVTLCKEVPLTEGRETAFSISSFEMARARANTALRTGESLPANANQSDLAAMEAARRKTSKAFYENLIGQITRTTAALAECERALDPHLGMQGPSFTPLKDMLTNVLSTATHFGADVGLRTGADTDGSDIPNTPGAPTTAGGANTATHSGPITDRASALAQLRQVADFFRRTEPHSPVAYLADKAATWGDMPLHTWLKSVVKDPTSLAFIEEMLDVKVSE
jgi:type VI secretion system protein ImpA